MASSTIKRKETKPGDIDELSPFKRLRIYAPEKDKKEAEQSKKCNSQTEKAFRKQGMYKYITCLSKYTSTFIQNISNFVQSIRDFINFMHFYSKYKYLHSKYRYSRTLKFNSQTELILQITRITKYLFLLKLMKD